MKEIGAKYLPNGKCAFTVWAPEKESMILEITHPKHMEFPMIKDELGYFTLILDNVLDGCRYFYKPAKNKRYPDPASFYQPEGVHSASQVWDHRTFVWTDKSWHGLPLKDLVFYELHVGTFTPEGTFEAIIPRLKEIASIGINALELMPVNQFPGNRNWGYDGVYIYAVQNSYGGPDGLKKLINACHEHGIAVFLDVVYNHLGPEGNYVENFAPYFSSTYNIPWGKAMNFDGDWSDGVKEFILQNVRYWFEMYRVDGLRVDAIHTIFDNGAVSFWEMLHSRVTALRQKLGRALYLIAESDLNSPKVVKTPEIGGFGMDAQWLDDFHHALYVLLDTKGKGRYIDFGQMSQFSKAYTDGFVHSGEFVTFRKRKHGAPSAGIPGDRFVAFNQNHDQVGNRVLGERLSVLVDFDRQKVAIAALILSPYLPLLFMGEEYGEDTPFFYFISHSDKDLIEAVRTGRKREFAGYHWKIEPPDPQNEQTFLRCKLQWEKRKKEHYHTMSEWVKELVSLRRGQPALENVNKNDLRVVFYNDQGIVFQRKSSDEQQQLLCIYNFSETLVFEVPSYVDVWYKILDSLESKWHYGAENLPVHKTDEIIRGGQTIEITGCCVIVYSNNQP